MPGDKHSAPCGRALVLSVAFIESTSTTAHTPVNTFPAVQAPCHGHPAISSIRRSLWPLCAIHSPTLKDQVYPLAVHNIIHIACAPHTTHTHSLPQHPRIPLAIIHRMCTFPLTFVHLQVCTCRLPPAVPPLSVCHPDHWSRAYVHGVIVQPLCNRVRLLDPLPCRSLPRTAAPDIGWLHPAKHPVAYGICTCHATDVSLRETPQTLPKPRGHWAELTSSCTANLGFIFGPIHVPTHE